ncbi:DUF3320 domain-containing protein [Nocardia sp. SYP-A9097]|uniref:DUF3320 domain-containing protein n=1 Tax=Nocardia sp. SYP-A9097 TaxID=2663237 RepID=UPI00129BC819|nr:DUF3320 domain-containing protein [Nocardia sp. SYP-A9097]MRH92826.1 DUF3320 domain-containing protein [Nocardia sp. SYP-A9097]
MAEVRSSRTSGGASEPDPVKEVLSRWRSSLIDLSGRNRLLNFRHTKSATLEVSAPAAVEFVERLTGGLGFAKLPDTAVADGETPRRMRDYSGPDIVTDKVTAPELHRALRNLRTKASAMFLDYGLWTLQVGVGMLRWGEDGAQSANDAPLILIPVVIDLTNKGEYRLRINPDDDPRHNPALGVKLEQFHIDWSDVVAQEPTDLSEVLAAARRAIAHKPGWTLSDRVVVGQFASHKEIMYKDLLENQDRIVSSDLVRAVALGPRSGLASDSFDFEEIDIDRVDELSPPERSPLILDADASQRQAVAAAVGGESFVLDGPPGTGKSQTIANMIAGLLHVGKTVLFVSEKAAALDVVLDRLRSTGLDSYALPIHSHNTSRRVVAKKLGDALREAPHAARLSEYEISAVRDARESLSAYADAMNAVRGPLGATLHDEMGAAGLLNSAPLAYDLLRNEREFRPENLTRKDLSAILHAAESIAQVWSCAVDKGHPWRGLRPDADDARFIVEGAREALCQLEVSLERYRDLTANGPVRDDAGTDRIEKLVGLLSTRRGTPESWLTTARFADLTSQVDKFIAQLRGVRKARSAAGAAAGENWEDLPTRLTAGIPDTERALRHMVPPGLEPAAYTAARARRVGSEFTSIADHLDSLAAMAADLSDQIGLYEPLDMVAVRKLCDLLDAAAAEHRPPAAWLTVWGAKAAEQAAISVLADRLAEFLTRRDTARAARVSASNAAGPHWAEFSVDLDAEPSPAESALARLMPAGMDLTPVARGRIREYGARFDRLQPVVDAAARAAAALAAQLGCAAPGSTALAHDLIELAESARRADRALDTWFDPAAMGEVRDLTAAITTAAVELETAREAAADFFQPELVHAEAVPDAVADLLAGARGIGGLMSRRIRNARKVIAATTVSGTWKRELYEQVQLAAAWHAAHTRLHVLARDNAELLGRYAGSELPDVEGLRSACAHAELIHALASEVVDDPIRRATIVAQLADDRTPVGQSLQLADELRAGLVDWQSELEQPPFAEFAVPLMRCSLVEVSEWLRAHLEPIRQTGAFLDVVAEARALDSSVAAEQTLSTGRAAVDAAREAREATRIFSAGADSDRLILGTRYAGLDTELQDLDRLKSSETTTSTSLLAHALSALSAGRSATDVERELLGSYAAELDTVALREALDVAHTVKRCAAHELGDDQHRARLQDVLAEENPRRADLSRSSTDVRIQLETWETHNRGEDLAKVSPALVTLPLREAAAWLRAHVEPFEDAADYTHSVARILDRDCALTEARTAVRAVAAARSAQEPFDESDNLWRELLGDLYRRIDTVPEEVRSALDWADLVRATVNGRNRSPLSAAAARLMSDGTPDPSFATTAAEWKQWRAELTDSFEAPRNTSVRRDLERSHVAAEALMTRLIEDEHGPEGWQRYVRALGVLREFGLAELPTQLAGTGTAAKDFPAAVERTVRTAWIECQLADPRLGDFAAADRNRLVERFRNADRQLVQGAYATVIAACNERRPRRTNTGAAQIITAEAAKKAKHMPVRQLLDRTREVTQRIKPCFMMSPLTVSQFLPSDFRFDVVIFDEASQVLPQDAVNSIYRGDALIVAGDQKQLPPTDFFSVGTDDGDDEWDENDTAAVPFESVLDLCKGSGVLRSLSLRWHYRSRHEHLIAFSNNAFYGNSMVTFPSAHENGPDIGLEFIKVDGVYDRGRRKDNQREADAVARRVLHHILTRPELTLGVVAFSKAQAEAIENAVRQLCADRPELDHFFVEDRLDGFFVKNLETVQGDERDVIILSVGYGPDEHGRLRSEFGPINRKGGERRLNVAITRARRRMEVVASFYGGDLPESANLSVSHFRRYLMFAERGPQVLAVADSDPNAVPESPFEEDVLTVLRDRGYAVQPQVGVAGYRIDMAIRHPEAPGTYALGIECDGAMYHSSRAARDRDRLREGVLRELGWRLHRIWGTDWYRYRTDAIARLIEAVESACAVDPHPDRSVERSGHDALATDFVTESRAAVVEFVTVEEQQPEWIRPYEVATDRELVDLRWRVERNLGVPGVLLNDPAATPVIAEVVRQVVTQEGPVEEQVVIARVRSTWGLTRATGPVQTAVRGALDALEHANHISRSATAYSLPGHSLTAVRSPAGGYSRNVGDIPSTERQLALRLSIADTPGMQREDALRVVAGIFGWSRVKSGIRAALTDDIDILVRTGILDDSEHGLRTGGDSGGPIG